MKINLRYPLLFFALLILVLPLPAYSDTDLQDTKLKEGLSDVYNLRFEDAARKFKEFQSQFPKDIKGYYYESLVYFYTALVVKDDNSLEKYLTVSGKVLDRCEENLNKNENDGESLFYKGETYSFRSILMLYLNKNLLKAASNGNDGYRILKDIIKKDPAFYDAYLALGLFKIAIGYVPEKYKWLLSIIGFEGSVKEGISMLKSVSEKGNFNIVSSKLFLGVLMMKERESDNSYSLGIMKSLTDQYPESPASKVLYGWTLFQNGFNDEAISELDDALRLNTHSIQKELFRDIYGLLGNAYFRKNDFEKSAEMFEHQMKYVDDMDRYNPTLYSLGICYEMEGKRNLALSKFNSAREKFIDERDGENDKLYLRLSKEKIMRPLNEFDSLIVIGVNNLESGKLDDALAIFNNILKSGMLKRYDSDDEKIRLYHELGKTYFRKGNYDKAIEYLTLCITLNPVSEKWTVPHSYFELGKIYDITGNKKKAEEMFEKIFDFNDYDLKMFLEMRLKNYKEIN